MSSRLPILLLAALLPLAAEVPRQSVEDVTAETVDFAPGGTIHITGSAGELNIQAWDQPQVQVTVTRSNWVHDTEQAHDKAMEQLKDVNVTIARNNGDLTIATTHHHSIDINIDYRIMVPRTARLAIRHETGDVIIDGVDADIDAEAHAGGILLMIPEAGQYDFDVRCTSGGIYSDFSGKHHHAALTGETFVANGQGTNAQTRARRIHLRVRLGGIEIQKMLPFRDPAAQSVPGAKPASGF